MKFKIIKKLIRVVFETYTKVREHSKFFILFGSLLKKAVVIVEFVIKRRETGASVSVMADIVRVERSGFVVTLLKPRSRSTRRARDEDAAADRDRCTAAAMTGRRQTTLHQNKLPLSSDNRKHNNPLSTSA